MFAAPCVALLALVQGVLWPVFHHVVDVYGDQVMRFFTQDTLADLWQCYANVNRRFRDKIVEVRVCAWSLPAWPGPIVCCPCLLCRRPGSYHDAILSENRDACCPYVEIDSHEWMDEQLSES